MEITAAMVFGQATKRHGGARGPDCSSQQGHVECCPHSHIWCRLLVDGNCRVPVYVNITTTLPPEDLTQAIIQLPLRKATVTKHHTIIIPPLGRFWVRCRPETFEHTRGASAWQACDHEAALVSLRR